MPLTAPHSSSRAGAVASVIMDTVPLHPEEKKLHIRTTFLREAYLFA
jgi:hypothetical protein